MDLKTGTTLHGFSIEKHEVLPEIEGDAFIGVHEPSKAKLLYLANDDNNKSFAIGFRTPPKDDTGVFHILEHSVLCGSQRFPVKEPFVDLLKSSMQTFLNAMTFADKTLYPVASTNEQDLFNLMDVYLDAVFHPQIYRKRAIFEQEGWHYELKANGQTSKNPAELTCDETTLVHNGVVFNEMRGALSDAGSVLYDEVQKQLFDDTCYAFESGGTPAAIPTLTYEEYLDEHGRHYRTDNSFIILYGNLDIDRALEFLDERYLSPVAEEQRASDEERTSRGLEPLRPRTLKLSARPASHSAEFVALPPLSDRCGGCHDDTLSIPVPDGMELPSSAHVTKPGDYAPLVSKTMDTAPENACAACGYVIGDSSERQRAMAVEILLDALFGSNEAPLKRALLDEGIAHDIHASVSDALLQPFALVELQMPAEGAAASLQATIERHVGKLVDEGLDKQLVEAAISHAEFQMREHDMGIADGVAYAMLSLASWLYDDDAPIDYLRYEHLFAHLRSLLENDYYEQLCKELFCDNGHVAAVEIVPTPGQADDDSAERLALMNEKLSPEERRRIVEEEALLRKMQEAPDTPEALATLPRLSIADIDEAPEETRYDLDWKTPITCLRHSVATRGISYAYRYFDMDRIAFEDLPYVTILTLTLGKLDTARHSAAELDTLVQARLGNLNFYTEVFEHPRDVGTVKPRFVVSSSALSENVLNLSHLPREVMLETDFSNTAKILDILKQRKIGMEHTFANSGHSSATARVKSYYSTAGVVREKLGNVGFYRFLCDLIEHFDERSEALPAKLAGLCEQLFCDDRCTVSFAGADDDYDRFWLSGPGCNRKSVDSPLMKVPEPHILNEAFIVPSDVSFASMGWDRRLLDMPLTGAWSVASRALSFDYLWNEVRVKGGAYGVGFTTTLQGNMRFYSYRDPHLDETLARFAEAPEWLGDFNPAPEALEGFVVASVAGIDAPVKPRELIRRQAAEFFSLRKPEERRVLRTQILDADAATVRNLAPAIERAISANAVCVFGNREILESSEHDLKLVQLVG